MTTALHQTIRVAVNGDIERGIDVPHDAANIPCAARLPDHPIWGEQHCRRRIGHRTPKGETAHLPEDYRIIASPPHIAHTQRFMPNQLPPGVRLDITIPHDCENHLADVLEVERGR
jgi:hypothetical protein